MIDSARIRGLIAEKGLTKKAVAKELNMTDTTLRNKLNRGVLGSDDIEKLIVMLDIKDPVPIFFKSE